MNYSETYFELDSEEATHCYHCHLICLKGHVETVDTKDQRNAIVYGMFVDTVNTKIKARKCIECYVCRDCRYWCLWLLHNTLHRVLWGVKTLHKVSSCPCQGGRHLMCLPPCGLSWSPVWGGSFVNFLGLVNYKGDCRQDIQLISNS